MTVAVINLHRNGRSAFSYSELIITLIIIGILSTLGAPRFAIVTEQARVDAAATMLATVHAAQRIYWLETSSFAPSLDDLIEAKLLDPSAQPGTGARFTIRIETATESAFDAVAQRRNGEGWTGQLNVTQDGIVTGQLDPENPGTLPVIRPPSL